MARLSIRRHHAPRIQITVHNRQKLCETFDEIAWTRIILTSYDLRNLESLKCEVVVEFVKSKYKNHVMCRNAY